MTKPHASPPAQGPDVLGTIKSQEALGGAAGRYGCPKLESHLLRHPGCDRKMQAQQGPQQSRPPLPLQKGPTIRMKSSPPAWIPPALVFCREDFKMGWGL